MVARDTPVARMEIVMTSTVTFVRVRSAKRGASSYRAKGLASGTVYLSKNAFNGEHPETLVVQDVPEPLITNVAETKARRLLARVEKSLEKAKARAAALEAKAAELSAEKFIQPASAIERVEGDGFVCRLTPEKKTKKGKRS
jgi:hypothetical protein